MLLLFAPQRRQNESMVEIHHHHSHSSKRRIIQDENDYYADEDELEAPFAIATLIPDHVPSLVTWTDLNVVVRQELHPSKMTTTTDHPFMSSSCTTKRKASTVFLWDDDEKTDETTIQIVRNNNDLPELIYVQDMMTMAVPKEEQAVQTSFGWSDFPLLVQPSHTTTLSFLRPDSGYSNHSTTTTTSSSLITSKNKQVRFGNVKIRRHDIELGDHPLCESFPITLSWSYHDEETVVDIMEEDNNEYENLQNHTHHHRASDDHLPHSPLPLRMRAQQRRDRLANFLQVETEEIEAMEAVRRDEQEASYYHHFLKSSSGSTMLPRVPTLHVIAD
jgi:hypothetical protein